VAVQRSSRVRSSLHSFTRGEIPQNAVAFSRRDLVTLIVLTRYASKIQSRQPLPCASSSLYGSRIVGIRRTSRSTVAMSRPMAQDSSRPQEVRPVFHAAAGILTHCCRWPCADLVDRSDIQRGGPQLHQAEAACFDELPFRHNTYRTLLAEWQGLSFRGRRQDRMRLYPRPKSALPFSHVW